MADPAIESSRRIEELQALLAKREAQLKAANGELDSVSYGISHDLRSPLRAVSGFAQMLEEDCGARLDENGRRYLSVIRASAAKLDRSIEALLAYSRVGRHEMRLAQVDMNALAARAVDALGASHGTRAIEVPQLPFAYGDSELLYQVWHHLLSNAQTYTSRRAEPRIEISGRNEKDETLWSVRDNGAGFDMRYAQKLFGMFQRMHADEEFPGVGAGLAVARRIINQHGGRIWAEAQADQGATFYFSLPQAAAPPPS